MLVTQMFSGLFQHTHTLKFLSFHKTLVQFIKMNCPLFIAKSLIIHTNSWYICIVFSKTKRVPLQWHALQSTRFPTDLFRFDLSMIKINIKMAQSLALYVVTPCAVFFSCWVKYLNFVLHLIYHFCTTKRSNPLTSHQRCITTLMLKTILRGKRHKRKLNYCIINSILISYSTFLRPFSSSFIFSTMLIACHYRCHH